jgi:hypothetical protein
VLDDAPLVLMGTRLYAQRQWVDECAVAGQLRTRASAVASRPLGPRAAALLEACCRVARARMRSRSIAPS